MANSILINATAVETRVALLEKGEVAEFYVERPGDHSIVGNVYKGKVSRVLPGMQAAFVDIGLERAAFLYVTDFKENMQQIYLGEEIDERFAHATHDNEAPNSDDPNDANEKEFGLEVPDEGFEDKFEPKSDEPKKNQHTPAVLIQNLLTEGQEIIVQIAKAPIGTKGARLTSYISLPGRNVVLVPTLNHIGISRRIANEKERERLREMVARIKPEGMGFIVRTACENKSETTIREDMDYLLKVWEDIRLKYDKESAPCLLHSDLSLSLRATRDLFTADVSRLIIDDADEHANIKSFIETYLPKLKNSLELYQGSDPLFDAFNIEADLTRALDRKVWLKSGGYIIMDQMEALTAIDINTGRYVGKRNLEDTILKTNLEAVREIATQLRLRNIGGIIIIDFIDMQKRSNRDRVFNALGEALKNDRARTNILKISELGLVEMTRKRTQESLGRYLSTPCPYCSGRGFVKTARTVSYEVLRNIRREMSGPKRPLELVLNVHPEVANILIEEERKGVLPIERTYKCKISIKSKKDFHIEQFEIIEK